jgi:hypothetical protein
MASSVLRSGTVRPTSPTPEAVGGFAVRRCGASFPRPMSLGISHLIGANGATSALAAQASMPNAAGGSNGASVTVSLTFVDQFGNGLLPP